MFRFSYRRAWPASAPAAAAPLGFWSRLFPIELAGPRGIVLGGDWQTIHWHGQGYGVEFVGDRINDVRLENAVKINARTAKKGASS